MIFVAKNEKGESTYQLVLDKTKTVTRRMKPMDVGKEFAVQPGRGKPAVCRAVVIDCMNCMEHFHKFCNDMGSIADYKESEAHLEGFGSWQGLMLWFKDHDVNFAETYRIEFKVIK